MDETTGGRPLSPRELQALIEAERTGIPFIYWRDGDDEQHILMLPYKRSRATVGRREASDVPLSWDREVSREHALLEPVGESWTLVDDLCRPVAESSSATPATNPHIAAEVHLSVAVKSHLRALFDRFGVGELPQNEKRGRLVAIVLGTGVLVPRDF